MREDRCDECGSEGACRPGCGFVTSEPGPDERELEALAAAPLETPNLLLDFVRQCALECVEGNSGPPIYPNKRCHDCGRDTGSPMALWCRYCEEDRDFRAGAL